MVTGLIDSYGEAVFAMLKNLLKTQHAAIAEAGRFGAAAIRSGGLIHTFGTGHSHLLAEELFDRAGGLLAVNAILEPSLMLHEGIRKSTLLERMPGLAEQLLSVQPLHEGDLMIVASNSGRNAVPVEAALYARHRGLQVAAVTSVAHSQSQPPVHSSGKRLFEVADIVIDNGGVPGDGVLEVPGVPVRVCATSTVTGAFIMQAVAAAVIENLQDLGADLPVLQSANVEGYREHNDRITALYADQLRQIKAY
ncbi:MAG TPA: SIS domain-containing protein [Symbiobacteriaceae bacterium]|nr:SIS domain-containing protein [Symbiobacteriaceae bacterium]